MNLILIDCQNDFIDGSLPCDIDKIIISNIVNFINEYTGSLKIYYSLDWHSTHNKSFKKNGGIWPDHCIQNTWGAEVSNLFNGIKDKSLWPNDKNMYYKGIMDEIEEYSCFYATNIYGDKISSIESAEVYLSGIASEYCVRETTIEFLKAGKKVILLKPMIAYVDYEDHQNTLKELEKMGALIKE